MGQILYRCSKSLAGIFLLTAIGLAQNNAQTPASSPTKSGLGDPEKAELVQELDQLLLENQKLEDQSRQMDEQNQRLKDEIRKIREKLASDPSVGTQSSAQPASEQTVTDSAKTSSETVSSAVAGPTQPDRESKDAAANSAVEEETQEKNKKWGTYTPNMGYKVANTEYGDLNVSIYSYVRYLNQLALNPTYTNAFGNVIPVARRQDMQILKVQIKFLGWVLSPKLRYFLYAWTSNANQGQGAQVVLAGNLNYAFSKHFIFGGGIYSLPGTRSVEGNFPFWLSVDNRQIADEFFRPSYTTGINAKGVVVGRLRYQAMLGDNLSQLGVSAAQLDNGFNTFSSALVWEPTTGEFGQGFGDFENHEKLATRLAGHFTTSHETKQSQPSSDAFENTQIRLADGTVVFTPNVFGPGITVNELNYKMVALDSGVKYHGISLDGEYYMRWLNKFVGPGTASLPDLFDKGFQLQTSAMVVPKTLQAYAGGSMIFGKYGQPWDSRIGLNFFPFKNRVLRWNAEGMYLYGSPVGYTSVPYNVGSKGFVFDTNLELAF